MSSNRPDNRLLTRQRAQVIVLVALLAALGVGWYESRAIPAADIPLEGLPREIGAWEVASEEVGSSDDGETKLLARIYENDGGQEVHARLQATYTRLGSLRDWALAKTAEGWSTEHQADWRSSDGAIEARMQRLVKDSDRQVALTWYTSARSQSASLRRAEVKGWRDRLIGGKRPWASLYLVAAVEPKTDAEQAVKELAEALGPALREMMATTRPG